MNRLLKYGGEALVPHFEGGRWRRPIISKRVAAVLRKEAIANGSYGSFDPEKGGWDPAWDTPDNARILRPFKLHKRDRDREERYKKIVEALKGMDAKVEAHRESLRALKPVPGIEQLYKKLTQV